MKHWLKFGCFLTGWNFEILNQCSEASLRHLKKYTSALLILMVMWGFTGFCFAQRYINAPIIGCLCASFVFILIVIQIERQIILTVGSNWTGALFRVFIAVIMAFLGSAIIDQTIFGKDIERKMIEITDRQVEEQLPLRLNLITGRLSEIHNEIDSLSEVSANLENDINTNPTISITNIVKSIEPIALPDGKVKKVSTSSVSTSAIPNPKIDQLKAIQSNISVLKGQEEDYMNRKLNMEASLREELSQNVGFLEELSAMIELLSTRKEALVFYVVVFCFFVSLELFIVTSKLSDKKCDYDLVIEHQLRMKERNLQELSAH